MSEAALKESKEELQRVKGMIDVEREQQAWVSDKYLADKYLADHDLAGGGYVESRPCGPMEARLWHASLDEVNRGLVDL